MITEFFKWNQSLTRLLATPAGSYLSQLSDEMKTEGFSYWILRRRLQGAAHFSHCAFRAPSAGLSNNSTWQARPVPWNSKP